MESSSEKSGDEGRDLLVLEEEQGNEVIGEECERRTSLDDLRETYKLPDNPSCWDKFLYPVRATHVYFKRLSSTFGWRFIAFLFVTQFLVKGILMTVMSSSALPIFKGLGISAVQLQLYMTIAMSPWSLKPLIGVASDLFPIGGYHKRYWIIQSVLVGIVGSSLLMIGYKTGAIFLVLCYVAVNYEVSICDLLSEGKYSELMRDNPISGTDIITFVQGCNTGGLVVAMCFVGPIADEGWFHVLFFIAIALSFTPVLPTLVGWMPEGRRSENEPGIRGRGCCLFNISTFRAEKGFILVVALAGFGGPVLAALSNFSARWVGILAAITMLIIMIVGCYLTFPRIIANVALYLVLTRVSKPSIGSAMDYFYTAEEVCLPGGPAFSFKYYITYTGILGSAVSFVAVWIYQAWMAKWKFRTVLLVTLIMSSLGGTVDLIIVKRWNLLIGIPDRVFYVLGEAILENVVSMLFWIPSSAIIGKVCSHGLEAATYAFLAGMSNFAGMVAELTGAIIFEKAGIETVSPNCNFEALYWLIIVCHIGSPLIVGVPATLLIPNKRQTDQLVQGGNAGTEEVELEEDIVPEHSSEEESNPKGLRLKAQKTGEWIKKRMAGEETNESLIEMLTHGGNSQLIDEASDDETRSAQGFWVDADFD